MTKWRQFFACLGVCVAAFGQVRVSASSSCDHAPPCVYRIVTQAALDIVPPPLGTYLKTTADEIRQHAIDPGIGSQAPDARRKKAAEHFLYLDVSSSDDELLSLAKAAAAFPRDPNEVKQHLAVHWKDREGGSLPWRLAAARAELVDAFRIRDASKIVQVAGAIVHFSADASMPFRATRCQSEPTHQVEGGVTADGLPAPYAQRAYAGPIESSQERLQFEVRVWPGRYVALGDPVSAIFAELNRSHAAMATLRNIDAQVRQALPCRTREGCTVHANFHEGQMAVYRGLIVARVLPIVEERLEAGALLAANLIGGAWEEAGRPSLTAESHVDSAIATGVKNRSFEKRQPDASAPARTRDTEPRDSSIGSSFAGSKNSTIYHRDSCAHVVRMSPDNLVQFESRIDAESQGRKPCKTCKPDQDE